MKKTLIGLLFLSSLLTACAGAPVQYPDEMGTKCLQLTEADEKDKEHTCLRMQSFRDAQKWHRVRDWQEWGNMPDSL